MALRNNLITAVLGTLVLTLVLGIVYPLAVTGVSLLAFPGNANGQRVYAAGHLVGSKLIGQSFKNEPRYFQSRPSGTTPADNAAGSSFANHGPNNVNTEQAIAANIEAYIKLNGRYVPGGLTAAKVPVDAVDTSASGIDPQISPDNAHLQAYRIAAVRGLSLATVARLVAAYTSGRGLGFSGDPGVNVLEINLALDRIAPR